MSKSLIIVASLFPAAALAAQPAVVLDTLQMPNAHQSIEAHAPIRLSMGPGSGQQNRRHSQPGDNEDGLPM